MWTDLALAATGFALVFLPGLWLFHLDQQKRRRK